MNFKILCKMDYISIGNNKVYVSVRCILCDTPARSFIKGTVSSNAYHGCTKCTVIGEYYSHGHHMRYPRFDMPLRTNISFRQKLDPDRSPKRGLTTFKITHRYDKNFSVPDPLHLLDLGIMKRCLGGWVNGSFNCHTKLYPNH